MKQSGVLEKLFKGWRVLLPILLGLAVFIWMFLNSLHAIEYKKVADHTGNYSWVDGNNNHKVDTDDPLDFQLTQDGDYVKKDIKSALATIHWTNKSWFYLAIAIVFMVGRDFFYIARIRLLTNRVLSWKKSTLVILLWEFASALTPGVVGGAAVAMFILNREKVPLGRATAIVIITAFMDNLFFVLMIPFVFLFIQMGDLFSEEQSLFTFFWIGYLIVLLVCITLYLSIFKFPKLATKVLSGIFSLPLLSKWKAQAIQTGIDVEKTSSLMKKEPKSYWIKVFLMTLASWTSRYLVINAIFQAFIGISFFNHIILLGKQLILWLIMLVSPTPGGSGVAEYAFGELLSPFTESLILLTALAFVWRLISYYPYLIIGVFLLPRWLTKRS